MARYLQQPNVDQAGLRDPAALPEPLPYSLKPQDAVRMVEDLYELLHDLNAVLAEKDYERLEELHDAAGFSGLISRAVTDGLAKFSRALVKNDYPGGFPDLVPKGEFARDRVQRGDKGLEVKASRFPSSWQSHSPREAWFCIVQFDIDNDEDKATVDREPTTVQAVMIARLREEHWSWQPAGEGKKRTGTASVTAAGRARLRANAVWVAPDYEAQHQVQLINDRLSALRKDIPNRVLAILKAAGAELHASQVAQTLSEQIEVPPDRLKSPVNTALRALAHSGHAVRTRPTRYLALTEPGL